MEAFRFRPGLITQLDAGSSFDFLPGSQWLSMGRFTASTQTLYGFRAQRAGRGLLMGFKGPSQGTSSVPTLGSPVIEWVGDGLGSSGAGDLIFATSTSSTSTTPTQVMKMRANATCVLSSGISAFDNNPLAAPKLEISSSGGIEGLNVFASSLNNSFVVTKAATFSSINSFNGDAVGIKVIAKSQDTRGATGIDVEATSGRNNEAINARAFGGSDVNIAINARVFGDGDASIAIYGQAPIADFNNSKAGVFNGDVSVSGALLTASDVSLKQNITKETNMLSKLKSLTPVNYTFKQEKETTGLNLPTSLQHGFVAQELEKVFPELVRQVNSPIFNEKNVLVGHKKFKAVNYIELISVLVAGIQELDNEVQALKQQSGNRTVVLNNENKFTTSERDKLIANSYSLEQNRPNPFSDQTTVDYVLPENETNASILLLNLNGQLINEYKLTDTKGSLTINGSKLAKGIYLYSLVSNNLEIVTKKMILK